MGVGVSAGLSRETLGHVALHYTSAFCWCARQCWGATVSSFLQYQLDDVYSVCIKQEFLLPASQGFAECDSSVIAKAFEILLWKMPYKQSLATVGVRQL